MNNRHFYDIVLIRRFTTSQVPIVTFVFCTKLKSNIYPCQKETNFMYKHNLYLCSKERSQMIIEFCDVYQFYKATRMEL